MITAKAVGKDQKIPREIVLRDFVRYTRGATRGIATAAETEGREVVQRMVEIGRVSREEGERLVTTLLGKVEQSRVLFEQRVEQSVRVAMERLGNVSTNELSKLSGKIATLEKRLEKFARSRGEKG